MKIIMIQQVKKSQNIVLVKHKPVVELVMTKEVMIDRTGTLIGFF